VEFGCTNYKKKELGSPYARVLSRSLKYAPFNPTQVALSEMFVTLFKV